MAAQSAVRGGADFLLALSAGRMRNIGEPSIATMLPMRESNDFVMSFATTEILPRTSWRSSFSLSEYQVPAKALTDGRHTIALESDTAKSNTLVVFVGEPK